MATWSSAVVTMSRSLFVFMAVLCANDRQKNLRTYKYQTTSYKIMQTRPKTFKNLGVKKTRGGPPVARAGNLAPAGAWPICSAGSGPPLGLRNQPAALVSNMSNALDPRYKCLRLC